MASSRVFIQEEAEEVSHSFREDTSPYLSIHVDACVDKGNLPKLCSLSSRRRDTTCGGRNRSMDEPAMHPSPLGNILVLPSLSVICAAWPRLAAPPPPPAHVLPSSLRPRVLQPHIDGYCGNMARRWRRGRGGLEG